MKKFSFVLLLAVIFIFVTAFTSNTNNNLSPDTTSDTGVKDYYFKQCTFCHNQSERLAPYMPNIKKVYLRNFPNEGDFVDKIANFVLQPSEEKRLYKTIDFETMPSEMFHDPDRIKDVARYIYRENNL